MHLQAALDILIFVVETEARVGILLFPLLFFLLVVAAANASGRFGQRAHSVANVAKTAVAAARGVASDAAEGAGMC